MKKWLQEILICPQCLPHEHTLELNILEEHNGDITDGYLTCPVCDASYVIHAGVAVVVPENVDSSVTDPGGYNSNGMLSAYLWSHYADLLNDPDATDAYKTWASMIGAAKGIALDIGCAVGRLSFEMSATHSRVVGIDTSHSFIESARELLNQNTLDFDLIIEGMIREHRRFELNGNWRHQYIEFMVADAMALPFPKHLFQTVSSINILEKVRHPLQHIKEVNRVLKEKEARFAFSDPFSWDETISTPELWIGGKADGPYAGRGIDEMRGLFEGRDSIFNPALKVVNNGKVAWKIRKTENLWEHITSQFLVGER